MVLRALIVFALLGCNGEPARVLVLGDSNTCTQRPCEPAKWPEVLAARTGRAIENWGQGGMTAGKYFFGHGAELFSPLTGDPTYAGWHLDRMLAETQLARSCSWRQSPARPKVVISVGTNDLLHAPASVIPDAILALKTHTEEAVPCADVYVATLPPRYDGEVPQESIAAVNGELRQRVAANRLLDFDSDMVPSDFRPGSVHLTDAAQLKWATRAQASLFPE